MKKIITKEQYEELKKLYGCGYKLEDKALELKLITESDRYGYGIKEMKLYEANKEYYLEYSIYSSCD